MSGLASLPKSKWTIGTGRQVILKGDFADIEMAFAELLGLGLTPLLQWVDATAIRVFATSDLPANVMMLGFPDAINHGQFVTGGLTDSKFRQVTTNQTMDFDVGGSLWGSEKTSQWYVIYATSTDISAAFTLKAMPLMRFSSQASQVITLRNNPNSANIGYGLTTDELVGSQIYILSGASKGLLRSIFHNNNDNTTGGTIEYDGAALSMSQGDWFVVLPDTNFRFIGPVYNNSSGNIRKFEHTGDTFTFLEDVGYSTSGGFSGLADIYDLIPPMAPSFTASVFGNSTTVALGHPNGSGSQAGRFLVTSDIYMALPLPVLESKLFISCSNTANIWPVSFRIKL